MSSITLNAIFSSNQHEASSSEPIQDVDSTKMLPPETLDKVMYFASRLLKQEFRLVHSGFDRNIRRLIIREVQANIRAYFAEQIRLYESYINRKTPVNKRNPAKAQALNEKIDAELALALHSLKGYRDHHLSTVPARLNDSIGLRRVILDQTFGLFKGLKTICEKTKNDLNNGHAVFVTAQRFSKAVNSYLDQLDPALFPHHGAFIEHNQRVKKGLKELLQDESFLFPNINIGDAAYRASDDPRLNSQSDRWRKFILDRCVQKMSECGMVGLEAFMEQARPTLEYLPIDFTLISSR